MPVKGKRPDDTIRGVVVRCLKLELPPKMIAEIADCSVRAVRQIQLNMQNFGTPNNPSIKSGRPRGLAIADEEALLAWISGHSAANLADMRQFLKDGRGINVSCATISRVLSRRGTPKKKARKAAEAAGVAWATSQPTYNAPADVPAVNMPAVDVPTVDVPATNASALPPVP